MRKMAKGWSRESKRHSFAARGYKTAHTAQISSAMSAVPVESGVAKFKPREGIEVITRHMGEGSSKYTQKIYMGGLPATVWDNYFLQNYIRTGFLFGYIGATERSHAKKDVRAFVDKTLVSALRRRGLSDREIAVWLTSGTGRHYADNAFDYAKKGDTREFRSYLKSYAKSAVADMEGWGDRDSQEFHGD